MKAKGDKFYLLLNDRSCQRMNVCNKRIGNCCCKNLLGIKIDTKQKFEDHFEIFTAKKVVRKEML